MNIDVSKAIKELLFERNEVILPGLGGFISTPMPAAVDYVQGSVQPPATKLEFNTNLVINDGVLVNFIQENNVVTSQEATQAIDNFVAGIKEALEAREIVDLPEIGRLYKDYEHKIRFMPDSTNFALESFGLPTVKFNPIVRQKNTVSAAPATAKPTGQTATGPTKQRPSLEAAAGSWAEKILPTLIVLAAILLALSLFLWLKGCGDQPAQVPQERVNVKPKPDVADNEPAVKDDLAATDGDRAGLDAGTNALPPENKSPVEEKVEVEPLPGKKIFIVIHSFGQLDNAKKFARDLEKAGYLATTKKRDNLHRVGVEIPASRSNEVESVLKELSEKFKATPVVVDY